MLCRRRPQRDPISAQTGTFAILAPAVNRQSRFSQSHFYRRDSPRGEALFGYIPRWQGREKKM
jgi:hypothetical protein